MGVFFCSFFYNFNLVIILNQTNNYYPFGMECSTVRAKSSHQRVESKQKFKVVNFKWQKHEPMKGINYVTDDKNRKVAVQIDLKKYGELWEDFYDNMIAELRKDEEKIPLAEVIKGLKKEGRLDESI